MDDFDPFMERNLEHPITDCETMIHLLKACLGIGMLAMPKAFQLTGIITGIFVTIFVSAMCTFCSHLLVKSAHTLYKRTKVTSMSYADVAEVAFANGPEWSKKFSWLSRQLVLGLLFVTYVGTCSVYSVIIAKNFEHVVRYYTRFEAGARWYIVALLIPHILLSYVPNFKYLAPVSMVANLLMGTGLGITFYYLVTGDVPGVMDRPALAPSFREFPISFCLIVFAMEAIGVVMPLENSMKTPKNLLGFFGVLNVSMAGLTAIYIVLGFLGYLKYGEKTEASITLNLPQEDYAAQTAKVFIGLAVFCTYALQFFVCFEIVWTKFQSNFERATTAHNYVLRTLLVTMCVVLAMAVPDIGPFIGLIGAFCFSLLGIITPVLIEFVTYSENVTVFMVIRNVILVAFGFLVLVFGASNSIEEILRSRAI